MWHSFFRPTGILEHIFIVPSCGNMTDTGKEGHLVTSNIGLYKVSDLASGTNYR